MSDLHTATRTSAATAPVYGAGPALSAHTPWDTELFVLAAEDRAHLQARIADLRRYLATTGDVTPLDLSYTLNTSLSEEHGCRLAIVARDLTELDARLLRAAERLADDGCRQIRDVAGIYYFAQPLYPTGRIAALFPGEGAQYQGMLGDLYAYFPGVQENVARVDAIAREQSEGPPLSRFLLPPKLLTADERSALERELHGIGNAMYSVLMCNWAMHDVLRNLQLPAAAMAGHSAGELSALSAADCFSLDVMPLGGLINTMSSLESQPTDAEGGTLLLAVGAARDRLAQIVSDVLQQQDGGLKPESLLAMDNCPHQTVLVGPAAALSAVEKRLQQERLMCERLPLGRPYHTRWFQPFMGPLTELFDQIPFQLPRTTVYSCTTAQPFPDDPSLIRDLAVAHWASPVEFRRMIETMYDDGHRLFVEVGPRGNLTTFVEDILRGRDFLAVASNVPRRSGMTQLNHLAGQLTAHGVPLQLEYLYSGRQPQLVAWDKEHHSSVTASSEATASSCATNGLPTRAEVPTILPTSQRAAVMAEHLRVMEQLLDDQEAVMRSYLSRRGRQAPRRAVATAPQRTAVATIAKPVEAPQPAARQMPLAGQIVRHEPGQELVMRRLLDPAEDLYGLEHTVGGRSISRVDPQQHGLPIAPMTFTLEMMAEAASLLLPGKVVLGHENIQLMRWLQLDEHDPATIEITARRLAEARPGAVTAANERVLVEVRDLGGRAAVAAGEKGRPAAVGTVALGDAYPEPPLAGTFELTNEHPEPISHAGGAVSLVVLHRNLFHGERFQGTTKLGRTGEEGIDADVQVLPRAGLFRSTDDPQFILDPVLMDVIMHPMCAWHLEKPDQSGRMLLPFELESLEVFGPRPAEGTRFVSRARAMAESARQFKHAFEAIDEQGRLWCRFIGLKYWRFYVPFCGVNFHGPKDEYFLSQSWPGVCPGETEATSPRAPTAEPRDEAATLCAVRLLPPADLMQPAMQKVAATVVFSRATQERWRGLDLPEKQRGLWIFERLAAKDAVRLLYWKRHGQHIYPADFELDFDEANRGLVQPRPGLEVGPLANVALAHCDGLLVAQAAYAPHVGVAMESVEAHNGDESAARYSAARRAVAQALGNCSLADRAEALAVEPGPHADWVHLRIGDMADVEPSLRGAVVRVRSVRDEGRMVASTVCERVQP